MRSLHSVILYWNHRQSRRHTQCSLSYFYIYKQIYSILWEMMFTIFHSHSSSQVSLWQTSYQLLNKSYISKLNCCTLFLSLFVCVNVGREVVNTEKITPLTWEFIEQNDLLTITTYSIVFTPLYSKFFSLSILLYRIFWRYWTIHRV